MISAVWGSPQSCKTSVAAELAVALSQADSTVCLISSVDFSEMPLRFGVKIPPEQSISAAYQIPRQNIRSCVCEVSPNLFLLAPAAADSALSLICTGRQAEELLKAANAMFGNVIVDCTSWTPNALTGTAVSLCDYLLLTISSKTSAYPWHMTNRQYLNKLRSRSHIIMCKTSETYDYEQLLQNIGCGEPEIVLPYMKEYTDYANSGQLILKDASKGKAARKYQNAMGHLVKTLFFEA